MAEGQTRERVHHRERQVDEETAAGAGTAALTGASPEAAARGEELLDEMDALMNSIDAVLETNAQEFVAGYRQKGGQ